MLKNIGWLEAIFLLILIYLVLQNSKGFVDTVTAAGKVGVQTISVLQGRRVT